MNKEDVDRDVTSKNVGVEMLAQRRWQDRSSVRRGKFLSVNKIHCKSWNKRVDQETRPVSGGGCLLCCEANKEVFCPLLR